MTTIGEFTATTITGEERSLAEYHGRVLLVVNTASKCGFTPQYAGLQQLQDEFGDEGFSVLGFPCDQFADRIKWNFTKFLVDRHGNVLHRYGPPTKPGKIADDIRTELDRA